VLERQILVTPTTHIVDRALEGGLQLGGKHLP